MRRLLPLIALAACTRGLAPAPLAPLPFPVDTTRTEIVADGILHRYIYSSKGPWAINVLEVNLGKCNEAIAVKGADSAAGRTKTTVLLSQLAQSKQVLGGVNADFFDLKTGIPIGLLITNGRMLNPPDAEASLAFDSTGMAVIAKFSKKSNSLAPFYPREAVGGRIELIRDSSIVVAPDTAKEPSFVARNPRTAAGVSRNGKRLILVTIDGRQKPYSDGTTLHETAEILRALGAYDALNLDGGGSTTLVYRDSTRQLRMASRPSDKEGERPVGDALAIVRRCP
jgi:exopolysaccharide biosynthesis protein